MIQQATILVVIFCDFLMFYQIFLSPQVKRLVIISNKHCKYEYPRQLQNDLRLRKILGNQEILKGSQIFIELLSSYCIYFSHSALFHSNTKACFIYFDQDCLWKQYFASNSLQAPSTLFCCQILVNSNAFNIVSI